MDQDIVDIRFLIDRTMRLEGIEACLISAFNDLIEKQKEFDGETFITTVIYDEYYEPIHKAVNIKDIKPLTENEYYLREEIKKGYPECSAAMGFLSGYRNLFIDWKGHPPYDPILKIANVRICIIITGRYDVYGDAIYALKNDYANIRLGFRIKDWYYTILSEAVNPGESYYDNTRGLNLGLLNNNCRMFYRTCEGIKENFELINKAITEYRLNGTRINVDNHLDFEIEK